jgi:hypothetical protein
MLRFEHLSARLSELREIDAETDALVRRASRLARIVRKEHERRLVRALSHRDAAVAVAKCANRLRVLRDELLGRALDGGVEHEALLAIASIRFASEAGEALRASAEELRQAVRAVAAFLAESLALRGLVLDVDEHVLDLDIALAALSSADHALAHPRPRAQRASTMLDALVVTLDQRLRAHAHDLAAA